MVLILILLALLTTIAAAIYEIATGKNEPILYLLLGAIPGVLLVALKKLKDHGILPPSRLTVEVNQIAQEKRWEQAIPGNNAMHPITDIVRPLSIQNSDSTRDIDILDVNVIPNDTDIRDNGYGGHGATKSRKVSTNYILIDYENVQPTNITILDQEHVKVIIFLGAKQGKITIAVASALQRMASRAEYIQVSGSGSNALDFHIAFYIGQLATHEPDASFHIISNDTGFDPLIQHLKDKGIRASRAKTIHDIPLVRAMLPASLKDKIDVIKENLRQRGTSCPRTVKTLSSTINSLFQKRLSEEEIAVVIQELQRQKVIIITESKVSYHFPVV